MTKRQITRSQALPKNLFHGTPSMENSPSLTKGMKVIRDYVVRNEVGAAAEDVVIVAAAAGVGVVVIGVGAGAGAGAGAVAVAVAVAVTEAVAAVVVDII